METRTVKAHHSLDMGEALLLVAIICPMPTLCSRMAEASSHQEVGSRCWTLSIIKNVGLYAETGHGRLINNPIRLGNFSFFLILALNYAFDFPLLIWCFEVVAKIL